MENISSFDVKEQKKLLRAELLKKRQAISAEERKTLDWDIIKTFVSLSCFKTSDTLLLYYPIKGEIDVLALAEQALSEKKRIAFPRCSRDTHKMTFHYVSSLSELTQGEYGIPEPQDNAPIFKNDCAALCIVPALSLDREGFRLGYGGGYYDRFLDSFDGISASLCYDSFLVDELPADDYDITVDIIITEKEVYSPDVI